METNDIMSELTKAFNTLNTLSVQGFSNAAALCNVAAALQNCMHALAAAVEAPKQPA